MIPLSALVGEQIAVDQQKQIQLKQFMLSDKLDSEPQEARAHLLRKNEDQPASQALHNSILLLKAEDSAQQLSKEPQRPHLEA